MRPPAEQFTLQKIMSVTIALNGIGCYDGQTGHGTGTVNDNKAFLPMHENKNTKCDPSVAITSTWQIIMMSNDFNQTILYACNK